MKADRIVRGLLAAALALTILFCTDDGMGAPLSDLTLTNSPTWRYQLLPGSSLTDDCLLCGRPTITVPMTGDFRLRLLSKDPMFSTYSLENISFTAGMSSGLGYEVFGKGSYRVGGEMAYLQEMFLAVYVDNGVTNKLCYFTNASGTVTRPWPFVEVTLVQTNGNDLQHFTLKLEATAMRQVWFSAKHSFTPGIQKPYTNRISPGDLISSGGRIIKRNSELTAGLGLMPSPAPSDLGLDGVSVLPGGEIAFSVEERAFSETLGDLHGGNVLSDRGRIVTNYAALIGAFGPEPPAANEGLDALHVMADGEIYFSITNDFFSEKLGRMILKGDLLSSRGIVTTSIEKLIGNFNPADPKNDPGLDAIYVWPGGEVWFSVETGFYGQQSEFYAAGDVLSDRGYVVMRNRDLLTQFAPLEEMADFGLDALHVITDPTPIPPVRDVWFSTVSDFHSGIWQTPTNQVKSGDLISSAGRVVKRNHELIAELGLMPPSNTPDLGLDALDVLPGGEIVFSIGAEVFSETLGLIQRGDLVSNKGRMVARNQDLTKLFIIMPSIPDLGLDAVHVLQSGEVLFSVKSNAFSGLGRLTGGNLLSGTGAVVRSNQELLSRFHPLDPKRDYGLDALYVWPDGVIWFSVEEGFTDLVLGPVLAGDLLSDQGEVVRGNLSMLDGLAPMEDLVDVGLDALFVINDAMERAPGNPEPRVSVTQVNPLTGNVRLSWEGSGRVFQMEKATSLSGPWEPISPITIDAEVLDQGALTNSPQGYYRLREW